MYVFVYLHKNTRCLAGRAPEDQRRRRRRGRRRGAPGGHEEAGLLGT